MGKKEKIRPVAQTEFLSDFRTHALATHDGTESDSKAVCMLVTRART